MWNQESELNFLEIYQSEPILWEPTHRYHKDKTKINDAWSRISQQTGYTVEELKKKKNSLMATFRAHKREINTSLRSGQGTDEVFKPIWFAFDLMNSFLGHLYKCKETRNTENQNVQSPASQELGDSEGNFDENTIENVQLPAAGTSSRDPEPFISPVTQRRRKNPIELQEAGKHMKEAMSTLNKVLQKKEVPEDDCDRYGKILANKLRKLNEYDRLKLMWEIDGLVIKTIERKSATSQFVTSASPSPRPQSAGSQHSEPTISHRIFTPRPSPSYSLPSPNTVIDHPVIHIPESTETTDPPSQSSSYITILSDERLVPVQSTQTDIIDKALFDALR